ncbi:MAG: EAL domain-containing protein [Lachnospiraceae bacterium]|nr:EAL domain-containing protein [Lachnospiraceae bacterium]
MGTEEIVYFEKYTPVGDISTIALCIVFMILIHSSFINRTLHFLILRVIIYTLVISALSDMLFHISMNHIATLPLLLIYFLRMLYHISLFVVLCLYILYAFEAFQLEKRYRMPFMIAMTVIFVTAFGVEILGTALGFGFRINADSVTGKDSDLPIFLSIYLLFMITLGTLIVKYRKRVFRQVFIAVAASSVLAFALMSIQQIHGQSSFTVISFAIPVYTLLFMMHANPYDINIGTVGAKAFDDLIASVGHVRGKGGRNLYLMSLYMHELEDMKGGYPKEMQEMVRAFIGGFFKSPTLFQLTNAHMIMVVDKKKDPDYLIRSRAMLSAFDELYSKMQYDYKIVYMDSDPRLDVNNGYNRFLSFLHGRMKENSILISDASKVEEYMQYKYIVSQLADIAAKEDPDDPRVLVYCQPIYSIKRNTYDTAEALMRLKLPDVGMVYPDIFIPIAEEYGHIRILTRIILTKTCKAIKQLTDDGYSVRRVSINFSIYDIREDAFCDTVMGIIRQSGIEADKVAFEITESQNEKDFELIKERIDELKGSGIKFYLDDFGTGYSNFERIMELPFDIVKFDRSLVIASGNSERSRSMVTHLARMFDEADYAVLYEGVEEDDDEKRCIEMSAKYLQGYRYSKPIPIEQLRNFFVKKNFVNRNKSGCKCPVCGQTVFTEAGKYEICDVCGWEDDPMQRGDPNLAGGANKLSLNDSIKAWKERSESDKVR